MVCTGIERLDIDENPNNTGEVILRDIRTNLPDLDYSTVDVKVGIGNELLTGAVHAVEKPPRQRALAARRLRPDSPGRARRVRSMRPAWAPNAPYFNRKGNKNHEYANSGEILDFSGDQRNRTTFGA